MKPIIYFLFNSLLIGLSFSQAQAQNTVYGTGAGTGGLGSTHIGAYAGKVNTGYDNTFLGFRSGEYNTTGSWNTFLGKNSGYLNTTGSYNTFMGFQSGLFNANGNYNTFIGAKSGISNSTGTHNTFLGYYSGYSNTTGNYNTFLGLESGRSNTMGSFNTFLGNYSGSNNTTGRYNLFLGLSGGLNNTSGSYNTFMGYYSGYSNTSGEKNVFIGYMAGFNETGSNKLYIDNNDDNNPLLYGNFASNALSIGTKYTGNAYKLVIPGNVRASKYDVVSDERLKENVKGLVNVLEKVQQVNGISYVLKEEATARQDAGSQQKTDKAIQYGFLAQNIQEIFPELVTEDEGMLAVNYQGMIPILVEALKSLSVQKDSVVAVNASIIQQIVILNQRLNVLEKAIGRQKSTSSDDLNVSDYWLAQNHPNPFSQSTTIRYQVSEEAGQVGLLITNLQGVEVQRFDQLPAGAGEVQIMAGSLTPGTYVCTLFADGLLIGSQRMILTR